MKLIDEKSRVFPSAQPPFGMQHSGGIEGKPELVYPDDGWTWPDLNKPLTTAAADDAYKHIRRLVLLLNLNFVICIILSDLNLSAQTFGIMVFDNAAAALAESRRESPETCGAPPRNISPDGFAEYIFFKFLFREFVCVFEIRFF